MDGAAALSARDGTCLRPIDSPPRAALGAAAGRVASAESRALEPLFLAAGPAVPLAGGVMALAAGAAAAGAPPPSRLRLEATGPPVGAASGGGAGDAARLGGPSEVAQTFVESVEDRLLDFCLRFCVCWVLGSSLHLQIGI